MIHAFFAFVKFFFIPFWTGLPFSKRKIVGHMPFYSAIMDWIAGKYPFFCSISNPFFFGLEIM